MNVIRNILLFLCIVLFVSCREQQEEKKELIVEKNIHLKTTNELAAFLPKEIMGYFPKRTATGKNINDTMPLAKRVFSFASQTYFKNNDSINIELYDFKKAPNYFGIYSRLWSDEKYRLKASEIKSSYVSYGVDIDAWVVFDKPHDCTTASISIFNRFYLTYDCFGKNNPEFIKEAASKFDYTQLTW